MATILSRPSDRSSWASGRIARSPLLRTWGRTPSSPSGSPRSASPGSCGSARSSSAARSCSSSRSWAFEAGWPVDLSEPQAELRGRHRSLSRVHRPRRDGHRHARRGGSGPHRRPARSRGPPRDRRLSPHHDPDLPARPRGDAPRHRRDRARRLAPRGGRRARGDRHVPFTGDYSLAPIALQLDIRGVLTLAFSRSS